MLPVRNGSNMDVRVSLPPGLSDGHDEVRGGQTRFQPCPIRAVPQRCGNHPATAQTGPSRCRCLPERSVREARAYPDLQRRVACCSIGAGQTSAAVSTSDRNRIYRYFRHRWTSSSKLKRRLLRRSGWWRGSAGRNPDSRNRGWFVSKAVNAKHNRRDADRDDQCEDALGDEAGTLVASAAHNNSALSHGSIPTRGSSTRLRRQRFDRRCELTLCGVARSAPKQPTSTAAIRA